MLLKRNLTLKSSRWLSWDTFRTPKKSSTHHGHPFYMMVRLHWHCQKDLFATYFGCKGPPWRTNWNIECTPNPKNQPSSSRKWRGVLSSTHSAHWRLASWEWGLTWSKCQRRRLHGGSFIWSRTRQSHWGCGMAKTAGCERWARCSRIDSANTEVQQRGWTGVDDGQCNWNEEEWGSEKEVGQNGSMFHQLLYVSWTRVWFSDILWANGEQ